MRGSAIRRWPTAFWTAWCITLIAWIQRANRSARRRDGGRRSSGREVAHECGLTPASQTADRVVCRGTGGSRSAGVVVQPGLPAVYVSVPERRPAQGRLGTPPTFLGIMGDAADLSSTGTSSWPELSGLTLDLVSQSLLPLGMASGPDAFEYEQDPVVRHRIWQALHIEANASSDVY